MNQGVLLEETVWENKSWSWLGVGRGGNIESKSIYVHDPLRLALE